MAKTVKISSTTWKQIDDVLRGRDINVGFALGGGREQLSVAAARNVGSVGIGKNDVVSLTGVLIDSTSPAFFEGKYGFTCTDTLSSPDKPCGVALEPIVAGAIGKVAVFGHVAVRVNMTDASHEYAAPSATVAGQLDSASSGPFRLIWTYATSIPVFVAGLTWGVAIFPYATGGGASFYRAIATGPLTYAGADWGYFTANLIGGPEISVRCHVYGSLVSNNVIPRFDIGKQYYVTKVGDGMGGQMWYLPIAFQTYNPDDFTFTGQFSLKMPGIFLMCP